MFNHFFTSFSYKDLLYLRNKGQIIYANRSSNLCHGISFPQSRSSRLNIQSVEVNCDAVWNGDLISTRVPSE